MTEKRQCPKCGTELSPEAAQGLCPKCLLDAVFESQSANATGDDAVGGSSRSADPYDPASAETIPPRELESSAPTTPYLEWLARQFPQLDQIEHLGQGGMGVVYKARQRHLNRLVAVKLLSPRLLNDPSFAERFTREAQALARLNHPNIVQVYDFGQTDQFFYFVMEYVDGVNLRALIHDGKLNPEEALKIVPQICEALQFAHDEGIVHRDIKPENILIDKRGRVKIADFGLAKLLGEHPENLSLTGTGQLMGTLGYMAPEQLQQAHAVDHRADIYSLGVVFYEMLTGQLPIGRFEPPSKKVQVDVRLDEVVLRSLENEPTKRYQHASDVKTDVEGISRSGFGRATPASAGHVYGTQRKLRGLRWFLICVNLAVVALAAAVGEKSGDFGYTWTNPIEYAIKTVIIRYPVGAAIVLASLILSFGLYLFVSGWLKRDLVDEASVRLQAAIDARGRVKWPAAGLLITGILDCATLTLALLDYLHLIRQSDVRWVSILDFGPGNLLIVVLEMVVGILIIVGALRLKYLESRGSAIACSILAMVPRYPLTWLIGLPIGIWSLNVLADPAVKAGFASSARVQMRDGRARVRVPAESLFVHACLALATAIGVVLYLLIDPDAPNPVATAVPVPEWVAWQVTKRTVWAMSCTSFLYGVIVGTGALLMRRLRAHLLVLPCVVVAGIALPCALTFTAITQWETVPQWPIVIPTWLGMPVAVWAAVLLFQSSVRAAFDAESGEGKAGRRQPSGARTNDLPICEPRTQPTGFPLRDDVPNPEAQPEQSAIHQVKSPAIGLIITGALHMAGLALVGRMSSIELLILAIPITAGSLVVLGGVRMLQLQSYSWARTASILSVLAVGPGWLIGLPIGIWSLVVLNRPEVKRAFAAKGREESSELTGNAAEAQREHSAIHQVKLTAIGLLVAGALIFASPLVVIAAVTALGVAGSLTSLSKATGLVQWLGFALTIGGMYASIVLPLAVVVIVGALTMKQLLARWLAITAAVIAVLPLSVAWPVTLPFGIWALVVLNRQSVESAFASQTIEPTVLSPRIRNLGQWLWWTGWLGLVFDGALGVTFAAAMWSDMSRTRPASPHQLSPDDLAAPHAPVIYLVLPILTLACAMICVLITGVFFVRSARRMRELESFGAAVAACILALLPISPMWPISFPLGLWALALLSSRDARQVISTAG